MNQDQKDIARKKRVLDYAEACRNVNSACRFELGHFPVINGQVIGQLGCKFRRSGVDADVIIN